MKLIHPIKLVPVIMLSCITLMLIFLHIFNVSIRKDPGLILNVFGVTVSAKEEAQAKLDAIIALAQTNISTFYLKRQLNVKYQDIIKKASERHDVDPDLIKAIIKIESNYDEKAVSYRGAKGLMQLMPITAKELGVDDCFNPEANINGGVKYFKQLLIRFKGDTKLALAAYNAGSTTVKKYNGVPPFKSTQQYVQKVGTYYKLYRSTFGNGFGRV